MDIYNTSFGLFLIANAAAGYSQYKLSNRPVEYHHPSSGSTHSADDVELSDLDSAEEGGIGGGREEGHVHIPSLDAKTVRSFKLNYLTVYSLVMGADWMQGPYQYALYKDERHLPEHTVGALFAVGFLTAATSAPLVGKWADKHGRRQMCLAFCVLYALSCFTKLSSSLPVLFVGRSLGGISTTLLYSVFDAWMVHEHSARGLEAMGLPLSQIFGQMTTCSSLSAIAAGVTGQALADQFGTNVAPFMGSACLLGVAFMLILRRWVSETGVDWGDGSEWESLLTAVGSPRITAPNPASTKPPAKV